MKPEVATLRAQIDVHADLPDLANPCWAALYVMVSNAPADTPGGPRWAAKVGACERLRNVPNRLAGVEKKYQERVPGGSMRTVVQMELVGLSLYDGEEDYEFWPEMWEEVQAREFALRFLLGQELGRMHRFADYIHVERELSNEEWVDAVRGAWKRLSEATGRPEPLIDDED